MKKHSFNLTYVEGFLLLTNGISVSALHKQHHLLADQSTIIANLSNDFNKLSLELLEIKTAKSLDTGLASTKIVDTGLSYFPNISSYLDPKLLIGVALVGTVYYGIPYLSTKILLPSLKYIFIPVKSAAVALIPFLKETQSIEAFKDGCTYRVELIGNKLSKIEVRQLDSPNFESVSNLLTQYFLRGSSGSSDIAVQTMDKPSEALVPISPTEGIGEISGALVQTSPIGDISDLSAALAPTSPTATGDISEISETLLQDPMTTVETTNALLTALGTLS